MIQEYCLGLVTNFERSKILLMRKAKPDWQSGRLNGIGGKIELGETPWDAMSREWGEETRLQGPSIWYCRYVLTHVSKDSLVWFFHGVLPEGFLNQARTEEREDGLVEQVQMYWIDSVLQDASLMDNLRWMIPMILDQSLVASGAIGITYK